MSHPSYQFQEAIPTNGEMKSIMEAEVHPWGDSFAAAIFRDVDETAKQTLTTITVVLRNIETARRDVVGRQATCNPSQVAIQGLIVRFIRLSRPTIVAACKGLCREEVIELLVPVATLVVSASGEELFHEHFESLHHSPLGPVRRARARQKLQQFEAVLAIPGLLIKGDAEESLVLATDTVAAAVIFRMHLSHVPAAVIDTLPQADAAIVRGLAGGEFSPTSDHASAMHAIASVTGDKAILRLFFHALSVGCRTRRARSRDAGFSRFIVPIKPTLKRAFAIEATRTSMRSGRKGVKKPLSPRSQEAYSRMIAQALGAAHLPCGADVPDRLRGLGLPLGKKPSLLTLLRIDVIAALRDLRQARRDDLGLPLRSDVEFYDKLADFCAKDGVIRALAGELVQEDPAALEWLAVQYPDFDHVDRPGAPCLNGVERVYAQCYLAERAYRDLAGIAKTAPPSSAYHRRLGELFRIHRLPLAGVYRLLLRTHSASPEDRDLRYYNSLVAAYLALGSVRPQRISEWLEVEDLAIHECVAENLFIMRLDLPPKNEESLWAKQNSVDPVAVPVELSNVIRAYHSRRPAGVSQYWVHPDGTSFSAEDLRYHLERVALDYAPDLFPFGLGAHDLRPIVASDLLARYGRRVGCTLAQIALRDSEWTITDDYNCCPHPLLDPWVNSLPGQAEAIREALGEAIGMELAPSVQRLCGAKAS